MNMTSAAYDQMAEDDLYDIQERLEAERTDGWILLFTRSLPSEEGFVNVLSTPDLDLERSIMARWSRFSYDGFNILESVHVNDRRKAFEQVREQASALATEELTGSEKHQWFKITEADAVASLKAAA